jgi:hypothetical protein
LDRGTTTTGTEASGMESFLAGPDDDLGTFGLKNVFGLHHGPIVEPSENLHPILRSRLHIDLQNDIVRHQSSYLVV